ncbi:MAG: 2-dehydropantoate 2-reductase [Candidatus Heimdallarchaeota archaeon]|nr:2-dehydropantoate 2-reductase [Candidatus Heimdallarchaeota archaeon]MCK4770235.1 2-dehydropantoate 2-reductase [Candidatus Heimdallarchaeota archaeon]
MKAALIGLGAIGTIIAADLAKNDFPLYVVCKHQETLDLVKKRGLKVTGVDGEYIANENLQPVLTIEDLPAELDLVFMVTKLTELEDAFNRVKVKLADNFSLVTMTNGVIEEYLSTLIDKSQLMGCVVSFGASRAGHAESIKTSSGEMVIGRMDGKKQEIDDKLIELLSNTVPTAWSENIVNEKFTKLLINLAVTSFGVISGMTLGEMLGRKMTRIAFLTVITEGVRVGKKKGIQFQKMNNLNMEFLALTKKEFSGVSVKHFFKQIIVKIVGRKYKNLRSSSLQSIEAGRKTELDFINGYLIAEGEKYGLETPLNSFVLEEIHKIEEGKKKPSLKGLEELEQKTKEIWGMK